jgi:hypothetical protein
MLVVDPDTGKAYIIEEVIPGAFILEQNLTINATMMAVVPQFQYYIARREHTFFQETYFIGCHVHGDPQALLWLWSLVLYSILRYRESLLEANGFTQSSLSSGDMAPDQYMSTEGGEMVWTRPITLTGMVENSWLKTPTRVIESIALREKGAGGYVGGIEILSNSEPDVVDQTLQNWFAVDQDDPETDG